MLRSIGLTRRQVRSAISWQASTLTAVALGLGIPLGIVCGRVAWRLFAGQLGIMLVVVLQVIPGHAVSRPRVCLLPPATCMPAHWR